MREINKNNVIFVKVLHKCSNNTSKSSKIIKNSFKILHIDINNSNVPTTISKYFKYM